MDKKLTLKMSEQAIDAGKKYAAHHETSLSRLAEAFFTSLETKSPTIDPIILALQLHPSRPFPMDRDPQQEYRDYILSKNS